MKPMSKFMRGLLNERKPLIIAAVAYILLTGLDTKIWMDILVLVIAVSVYILAPIYLFKIHTINLLGAVAIHLCFIIFSFLIIMFYLNTINIKLVIFIIAVLNIFGIYYIIIISLKTFKHIHDYLLKSQLRNAVISGFALILGLLLLPDLYFSIVYGFLLTMFEIPGEIKVIANTPNQMFYYSFALHFAISLDSELSFSKLHQIIQNNSYLRFQHIAHYITNKLTELILITYTISLLIGYLDEKRKTTEEKSL